MTECPKMEGARERASRGRTSGRSEIWVVGSEGERARHEVPSSNGGWQQDAIVYVTAAFLASNRQPRPKVWRTTLSTGYQLFVV
jgi:hypothetical protein